MEKQAAIIYRVMIIQTIVCCWINQPLIAQSSKPLQQLRFKDPVLEKQLRYFAHQTKTKVICILLEKRDSAYLYRLSSLDNVKQVERFSTAIWGQWHNQIIIMTGGAEVDEVCLITQVNPFSHLLTYLQSELSQTKQPTYLSRLEYIFKVKDGREEWFKDNDGYDSRDFPQPK